MRAARGAPTPTHRLKARAGAAAQRLTRLGLRTACRASARWAELGGTVAKKRDEKELRLLEREPEPAAPVTPEIDAAESRWDPWLVALARMEEAAESRPN
jgi:hypothetical protein